MIEDSIKVVKELGMRYLWIDRYCIEQEDLDTRHQQIKNMHAIFADAELVLIAGAGNNPEYGLPGIRSRARKPQPSTALGKHLLVSALGDPRLLTKNSKWINRGWTYQEAVLARRRLGFTDEQMYFTCDRMGGIESHDLRLSW